MVYQVEYKWAGYVSHNVKAAVAGAMCRELADAGKLTPENLVEANRAEDAPLHDEFEWDDTAAAELYREEQGRLIIKDLRVIIPEQETQEPVRAFVRVTDEEKEYTPITVAVAVPEMQEVMLRDAKRDWRVYYNRYKNLTVLRPILDEVEKFLEACDE